MNVVASPRPSSAYARGSAAMPSARRRNVGCFYSEALHTRACAKPAAPAPRMVLASITMQATALPFCSCVLCAAAGASAGASASASLSASRGSANELPCVFFLRASKPVMKENKLWD